VLVCTLQKSTAVVEQKGPGETRTEIRKAEPLNFVLSKLDSAKPVVKFKTEEVGLELLFKDGETIWLADYPSTPKGIMLWTVNVKSRLVIVSRQFSLSGKIWGSIQIGKCE
jgi:hypothetical protein